MPTKVNHVSINAEHTVVTGSGSSEAILSSAMLNDALSKCDADTRPNMLICSAAYALKFCDRLPQSIIRCHETLKLAEIRLNGEDGQLMHPVIFIAPDDIQCSVTINDNVLPYIPSRDVLDDTHMHPLIKIMSYDHARETHIGLTTHPDVAKGMSVNSTILVWSIDDDKSPRFPYHVLTHDIKSFVIFYNGERVD